MIENDPWIKNLIEAQTRLKSSHRPFQFRADPGTILAINGGVAFMRFRDPQTGKFYNEHVPIHELKGITND